MSPSASAASVPGRIARCSSQRSAVRLRHGSIATRRAPRRRASRQNRQRWTLEEIAFVPQRRISFAFTTASGSVPIEPPMVARSPSEPAAEQMVRPRSDAPSR